MAYAQNDPSGSLNQDNPTDNQATPPPPAANASAAPQAGPWDANSWVSSALQGAKSSDDPNYWQGKVSSDPNVQNAATRDSALAYWTQRINQGNGNGLGNPLFQDGPPQGQGQNPLSGTASAFDLGPSSAVSQVNFPSSTKPYQNTADDSALSNILMQRAQQGLAVDPNDPIIKSQTDAFNATQQRSARNYLGAAAEKEGNNGNLTSESRLANENIGQATSGLQASLMQNELNSRRTEIQNALSEQGSLLSQRDQLALQRELGMVNAQLSQQGMNNQLGLGIMGAGLQQQGLSNQNQQFYAGLSQQDRQFLNNLGLQYSGLGSQNDQFAANFGQNATNSANYWDAIKRGQLPS